MKPEKLEPLLIEANDSGFGLVKGQPSGLQPSGQPCLGLLGLLPGMAAHDQESRRRESHPRAKAKSW